MRKFVWAIAVVSLLGVLGGGETQGGGKKSDKDKLQGSWVVAYMEVGGMKLPAEFVKDMKVVISGDKTVMTGGGETEEGTFVLDAGKTPKAIDFTTTSGKDKGKKQHGIYAFEGDDTVKFAVSDKEVRPTRFTTKEGDEFAILVLKRAK